MEPQLKQRLIGAVVLVSLAVLIIPAFLEQDTPRVPPVVQRDMAPMPVYEFPDAPAEPAPEVMEEVTEGLTADPLDMAGEMTGLPAPEPVMPSAAPAQEEKTPEASPTATADTGRPAPPAQIAAPIPAAEPLPPAARPGNAGAPQGAANGDWVIQLGSFSSMENADSLRARLIVGGFRAFVSPLQVDGKQSFRVRVSGGRDRVAAEAMRSRLREELGYSGMIVRGD